MNIKQDIQENLLASAAGKQWQNLHIKDHHGIVIPLFSLHSKKSCGIGEYPDLIPLIHWCRQVGFDIIQLLPLNDTGFETSPYSALSAYALNPIHIGLASLPYILDNQDLAKSIQELQRATLQTQRVDYKAIHTKRDNFLRTYYHLFGHNIIATENYLSFKAKQQFWLYDYAIFKAIKIYQKWKSWELWPEEFRNPLSSLLKHLPVDLVKEVEYQTFVQFLCFQQFEAVKKIADKERIYLKGDIPILINRESADTWRHPTLFSLDFSAGAPPDMYSQEGQNWGFPLYNWDNLATENYRWWIERLAVAAQFYHLYRIDHIVGFFRIWAIPLALKAKEGFFTPKDQLKWIPQGEAIMRAMLNNSSMLPIGEDLGTVPPEVKECLRKLGICGTKVMRWERNWDGDQSFIDPRVYPVESMTTVSTHDSESLKLWWKKAPEEAMTYAQSVGWHYDPELKPSQQFEILAQSHHSGSLFHINPLQEYLALIPNMTWPNPEDERINLPGVISEKNWSYRFLPSVEQIVENEELKNHVRDLLKNE